MENTIKIGLIVKVGLDDKTLQLAERLLGVLENKTENKNVQSEKETTDTAINTEIEKSEETDIEELPTLEELRAELAALRETKGKELVQEILVSVGVKRLSDAKKEDYGKLMKTIKEVK